MIHYVDEIDMYIDNQHVTIVYLLFSRNTYK